MAENIDNKAPAHISSDWNSFLEHLDKQFQIEYYFDRENWKSNTIHRMRVSHVYDPSHFWVVIKESELDAMHKYLHHFYSKYKDHYKIPMKHFKLHMYCICYTDEAFYRGILVNIPLAIEGVTWSFVFLIDFGYMAKVTMDQIYFMTEKLYNVPQFAIRACLSGLGPVNSSTWSTKTSSRFNELISTKVVLGQVTNTYHAKRILYLRLSEYNWEMNQLESVNDTLIRERLAKQLSLMDVKEIKQLAEKKNGSKHTKKVRLPFLMPNFDDIEKCACVDSIVAARFLDEFNCK